MKISGYYKSAGNKVDLLLNYDNTDEYDQIFLSKVFTDTHVPADVLGLSNLSYGGTGFYYDKSPSLSEEIEHSFPDYHLYDNWLQQMREGGVKHRELKYYLDYSIGFLTRGCFRRCEFCVNKNYDRVSVHSPLNEFYDSERPKICLLDDNFLGCSSWKEMLLELQSTGKKFQFKQGLDERILTDEKCELLFSSNYDEDFIFAFDNIKDKKLIEDKLKLIRKYTDRIPKFYVFCGFDRDGKWDKDFWIQDLWDLWERIEILMRYHCLPYIMRFNRYKESPYYGTYINLARWCNQPSFFKKKSYREFVIASNDLLKTKEGSCMKYLRQIEMDIPELAKKYFDIKYEDYRG